mmetsp:Transcript_24827/g.98567  ORF Transcript_24827/g.98567 Transcript_24827/m.98567 type:complete len:252 (-) Transcript_24827:789-1544(-)
MSSASAREMMMASEGATRTRRSSGLFLPRERRSTDRLRRRRRRDEADEERGAQDYVPPPSASVDPLDDRERVADDEPPAAEEDVPPLRGAGEIHDGGVDSLGGVARMGRTTPRHETPPVVAGTLDGVVVVVGVVVGFVVVVARAVRGINKIGGVRPGGAPGADHPRRRRRLAGSCGGRRGKRVEPRGSSASRRQRRRRPGGRQEGADEVRQDRLVPRGALPRRRAPAAPGNAVVGNLRGAAATPGGSAAAL